MQTKRYAAIISYCLTVVVLSSCKKDTPPVYSGEDFLFFATAYNAKPTSGAMPNMYVAERTFSFLTSYLQMDTIRVNQVGNFYLSIRTDGRMSDKDRPILLNMEGNGKEYAVLPHPDSIYMRANELEYLLNLKFVRPALSDTGIKTLTLTLRNNDPFKPENHSWHKVTYIFGNLFIKPVYYYRQEPVFGEFSGAKMRIMQEAINRKGTAYWQSDADMVTLNNFIDLRGEKHLHFDPFTYNDLYNLLENTQGLFIDISTGPAADAFNNVITKMVTLSNELLIEKKNAGHPVLDESGKEISFP